MSGFVLNGAGLLGVGLLLGSGGNGGVLVYVVAAIAGGGMAAAFGPLMTRVLSRVPVAIAADASGVIVTVNQLGIVVGVATFGSLVPEPGGQLPAHVSAAFALSSAHAYQTTSVALAGLAVVGMVLALGHVRSSRLGAWVGPTDSS